MTPTVLAVVALVWVAAALLGGLLLAGAIRLRERQVPRSWTTALRDEEVRFDTDRITGSSH